VCMCQCQFPVISAQKIIIMVMINIFVMRHQVVTSEALESGSVLQRRGNRESLREEECL